MTLGLQDLPLDAVVNGFPVGQIGFVLQHSQGLKRLNKRGEIGPTFNVGMGPFNGFCG
jgi:hypothetical protein